MKGGKCRLRPVLGSLSREGRPARDQTKVTFVTFYSMAVYKEKTFTTDQVTLIKVTDMATQLPLPPHLMKRLSSDFGRMGRRRSSAASSRRSSNASDLSDKIMNILTREENKVSKLFHLFNIELN